MQYIFVTVGTTNFDGLVREADSEKFVRWAESHGYTGGILIQRGNGSYVPSSAGVRAFDFKPSLAEDMAGAALVVSHAGSGSIIESLGLGKKTVVVVNTSLMHNHQLELAAKLADLGRVELANGPSELLAAADRAHGRRAAGVGAVVTGPSHSLARLLDDDLGLGTRQRIRTMAVMGSGGHTAEMARAVSGIDRVRYSPRTYVVAETDRISPHKIAAIEEKVAGLHFVRTVPRSREVGQSWLTTVWTTLVAFLFSLRLVWRERPDVVLCNGPGTCVPICAAARIVRLLQWRPVMLVYFESIARVTSLSLSARILRFFVDVFVVQWPELKQRFPRAFLRNFFFPL